MRLCSSGDESLVSGGKGECAFRSGLECRESGGKGDRPSGDRTLGTGSFGADLTADARLRGGEGE